MKFRHRLFVVTATLTIFTLLAEANPAAHQGLTSLTANARGKGTLTVGKEEFKLSNVVVKLNEDATCEIVLITDLQLFIQCTWTAPADPSKGIALKITGGANEGGATGSGKLLLRSDQKAIDRLSLEGSSNTAKRKIRVEFVAD
ncbi:MAG TPA: hypothetical protein VJU86_17210 [Pyrinomonadaceae bacterium]|nr:hypothetical protein [Pyrinomonadaceae bacterium]